MRLTPKNPSRTPSPDITPMIDVVFLLIIFFLTTSSLIELTRAPVELPEERGRDVVEEQRAGIVVNVMRSGELVVESESLTRAEFLRKVDAEIARLGGNASRLDLLLRADRSASLVHVNELAEALMERDIRSWRLATEVPGVRPGVP